MRPARLVGGAIGAPQKKWSFAISVAVVAYFGGGLLLPTALCHYPWSGVPRVLLNLHVAACALLTRFLECLVLLIVLSLLVWGHGLDADAEVVLRPVAVYCAHASGKCVSNNSFLGCWM